MPRIGTTQFIKLRMRGGSGSYILLPVLTSTQRNALSAVAGYTIYNSTTSQIENYNGSSWEAVGKVYGDSTFLPLGGGTMSGNIAMVGAQTVDGVDISAHAADISAHHPAEIAEGRGYYDTTTLLQVPGAELMGQVTISFPTNYIHYFPIMVRTSIVCDLMVIEVTTQASSGKTLRLGIYNANTSWQPTSLVLDAGTVAADAAAVVTKSISQTLTPGPYLLAIAIQETTALRVVRGGTRYIGIGAALGTSAFITGLYVANTYAAFAATGVAWTTVWTGTLPFYHALLLRVSTP